MPPTAPTRGIAPISASRPAAIARPTPCGPTKRRMRRYRRSRTISPSIPTGSTRSRNGNKAERPPLGPVRDRRLEPRRDAAGGDDRLYRRFRADADRHPGVAAAIAVGARAAARARRGAGGVIKRFEALGAFGSLPEIG